MKIIDYRSNKDIDVLFENGIVVEHRRYIDFIKGKIKAQEKRLGKNVINKQGLNAKIIAYKNNHDITIQFDDGTIIEHRDYANFIKGCVENPNYKERLFEESYNNDGDLMKIVEYTKADDIIVEFQDEYKYRKRTTYRYFKNGDIYNPYHKKLCGVGYIGDISKKGISLENTQSYVVWRSMIERCYSQNDYKRQMAKSYNDCTVCKEWHNFTNFNQWYEDNYYSVKNETMEIDKDILVKGNRVYSPETCCIVPSIVNQILESTKSSRGDCPMGVSYHKGKMKYQAYCNVFGKKKNLGTYSDKIEAFYVYKKFKEKYIKRVANMYKDYLPENVYSALYNWNVEITD